MPRINTAAPTKLRLSDRVAAALNESLTVKMVAIGLTPVLPSALAQNMVHIKLKRAIAAKCNGFISVSPLTSNSAQAFGGPSVP